MLISTDTIVLQVNHISVAIEKLRLSGSITCEEVPVSIVFTMGGVLETDFKLDITIPEKKE